MKKKYEVEGVLEADEYREEGDELVFYQEGKPIARFIGWHSVVEL